MFIDIDLLLGCWDWLVAVEQQVGRNRELVSCPLRRHRVRTRLAARTRDWKNTLNIHCSHCGIYHDSISFQMG